MGAGVGGDNGSLGKLPVEDSETVRRALRREFKMLSGVSTFFGMGKGDLYDISSCQK